LIPHPQKEQHPSTVGQMNMNIYENFYNDYLNTEDNSNLLFQGEGTINREKVSNVNGQGYNEYNEVYHSFQSLIPQPHTQQHQGTFSQIDTSIYERF